MIDHLMTDAGHDSAFDVPSVGMTDQSLSLKVQSLSKSFAGTNALVDFNLQVECGRIHGLVGENGSGKSTLIKLLSGFYTPDEGEIEIFGEKLRRGSSESSYRLGCRVVHQNLGLIEQLSILDNVKLSSGYPTRWGTIRRNEAKRQIKVALDFVGITADSDLEVGELNPASRTAVAVARALLRDPTYPDRLLVMDEPTATMPENEVEELLRIVRRVASSRIGVLYVTHRLDEINRLCDDVTVMKDGHQVGTFAASTLERERLITLMVGDEFEVVRGEALELQGQDASASLVVENLNCYPLRNLSFSPKSGSITGVAGISGSGRETVLGAIFGALEKSSGHVSIDGKTVRADNPGDSIRCGMAYVPPDRKLLGAMIDQTARENLTLLDLRPFRRNLTTLLKPERSEVRDWFTRLRVRPTGQVELPFAQFSGGNQQKIVFAKWMRINPKVFLLDEPTQGVDVGAKALLHEQLIEIASNGGTVVISSTDVDELAALCNPVLIFHNGQIVQELSGSEVTGVAVARACLKKVEATS
jgi:ribose transport system ATP-binding protein